ncbi:MAG TPA: DUF1292 domain-containing protein [Acholeplasmataceae bacterium]|nr:DUF1292 domain-containing protein [Acholeplasmataceae bacterium]
MKENQITLVNEDGTEELAEIIFTHENEGTNYVVFEIIATGEVSAAKYLEDEEGSGSIDSIETDEEWEMLEDLLEKYYDELEEDEEEDLLEE